MENPKKPRKLILFIFVSAIPAGLNYTLTLTHVGNAASEWKKRSAVPISQRITYTAKG
jgi:hypothetical protein